MLVGASIALAARSETMTSVARTRRSLSALDAEMADTVRVHQLLALDWHAPERFVRAIERHVAATKPPDLVVAWIHEDGLAIRLAEALATPERPPTFVHVVGSASEDVRSDADVARAGLDAPETALRYRQVVLGAHRTAGGMRWLTNDEISTGVLEAIEQGRDRFVVGVVP